MHSLHRVGYVLRSYSQARIASSPRWRYKANLVQLSVRLPCMARQSNSKKSPRWLRPPLPPLAGPMSLRVVCVSSATAHGRTGGSHAHSLSHSSHLARGGERRAAPRPLFRVSFARLRRRASTQLAPGPVSSERRAGLVLFDKEESDDNNRRRRDKDWSGLRRSKASDKRSECHSGTERRRSKVPRSRPTYSVRPIPGSNERLLAV